MHEGPVGLVFSKGAYTQEDKKTYGKSVNAALFLETVSDSHIPFPFCKGQGGYDKYSDDSDFIQFIPGFRGGDINIADHGADGGCAKT